MASNQNILIKLQPILREILDIPDLIVTEDLNAKKVPEWDSLNHMRILSAAEQEFSIRLTSVEVETIKNVGDFAALIASKI